MQSRWVTALLVGSFAGCVVEDELADVTDDANDDIDIIAASTSGQFVSSCEYTHRNSDDPIVYPRIPGAAHSHDFFGNGTTNAFSTLSSLTAATGRCPDRPGDTAAYWQPTVYADGRPAAASRMRVYYRSGGKDPATIKPFPPDLRMIAGTGSATSPQPISISSWACTVLGSGDEIEVQQVPRCPSTSPSLRLRIVFPDCWDGKNLDSADHKSHVAYRTTRTCPASHPVPLPQITMATRFSFGSVLTRTSNVTLSSGGSYSGHADFVNSWNQRNHAALVSSCINRGVDCADKAGPTP